MKFKKESDSIKKAQARYVALQKSIVSRVERLEESLDKYIRNRWAETFGNIEVSFSAGLEGGCLSNNWDCDVYFDGVEGFEYYKNAFYHAEFNDEPP